MEASCFNVWRNTATVTWLPQSTAVLVAKTRGTLSFRGVGASTSTDHPRSKQSRRSHPTVHLFSEM